MTQPKDFPRDPFSAYNMMLWVPWAWVAAEVVLTLTTGVFIGLQVRRVLR